MVRARRGEPGYQQLLDEAAAITEAGFPRARSAVQVAASRAEAAWLAGAEPPQIVEATRLADAAGPDITRWFSGDVEAWRYRAGVDCDNPSELPEPFRLEINGDVDGAARWWQARGCAYDAALALACSGDPVIMRRALDLLHDLGAQPAASVVARRLRALGAQGLPRGPRAATVASPAGLTRRETEVLALVAEGLANSEIATRLTLSARTVDHHVSAILHKLGVASRGEAGAAAKRLGVVADGP
jgi:DNA-binding CsgD family transcriptional regulator